LSLHVSHQAAWVDFVDLLRLSHNDRRNSLRVAALCDGLHILSHSFVLLSSYTRRRFGGRQPLWGMGVTSLIMLTSRPTACSARMAASRPWPWPLTKTSTVFRPCSIAARAATSAAVCAAKWVDFLRPRRPCPPEEAQEIALPWVSVTVTMVLLKEDRIWTWPFSMFFFSRRRRITFLPVLGAAIFFLPP